MTHFIFKAKRPSGEIYSGERDVADRFELYKLIREGGDEAIEVKERAGAKAGKSTFSLKSLRQRVSMTERIMLARNLGAMLQAGLALSRALSVLERQTRNKTLKAVLTDIIAEISRGTTMAEALMRHPKVFSPLFVSMVHAGEQSGTLSEALKIVATQMESSYTLERRIRGALMYPSVILCAMIIIAVLMLIFVIPTLMKTFTDLHVDLPITTRIILVISDTLQHKGLVVLAVLVIVGFAFYRYVHTVGGRKLLHSFFLKIPMIGSLVQEVNTARTARTLSSLLNSGVDVVESVTITADVVQNVHFKAVLMKASEAIKKGELMSKVFGEYTKLFPVFFAEMMSVGEETGKISEMLHGVATYYEEDVDQKTKNMSTIIEPFLMIVIGAAVGFFAVSMITPIYSLVNAI